jgi:hypothetical protein
MDKPFNGVEYLFKCQLTPTLSIRSCTQTRHEIDQPCYVISYRQATNNMLAFGEVQVYALVNGIDY